jgi:hypothetical protein
MTEFETIAKHLSDINEKLANVENKVNITNITIATHLAHYEECKKACSLHQKVLFGNGDGEKGLQYKVIELCKWKSLQNKVFWIVVGLICALIPIFVSNTIFAKSSDEVTPMIVSKDAPKK